jgi:DNA-directed RNA polymerase subunit RPC12/RpoP
MKLQCRQCGALLAVTSPDAYISCPYCGARSVVEGYTGVNLYHRSALNKQDVYRLFKQGAVASATLFWFPYSHDDLARVFTQPYPEMENYSPPSADRRVWNQSEVEGEVVPVDPELVRDTGVIYHPFWVVISAVTAQGTMVDGVSGITLGESADSTDKTGFDPVKEALSAFLTGLGPALVVFFALRGMSVFWAAVFGMASAVFAPELWKRTGGSRE